jgi:hypothetical protein
MPSDPDKTRLDFPRFFWKEGCPEAYKGARGKEARQGSPTCLNKTLCDFLRRLRAGDEQSGPPLPGLEEKDDEPR